MAEESSIIPFSQDGMSSTWETTDLESNPFLEKKSAPILAERIINSLQIYQERLLGDFTGWRPLVAYSCVCTALALVCNTMILDWASMKPKSVSGTFVLYAGDCGNTKSIVTWSHLGINIISTALLASSNYAMQILMAPTRESVNSAHRKQRSVAIGIPSLTNWTYMGRRKQLLYLGLLLTSIPFHTIYNSLIYDTISAVDFGMYIVTNDFFENIISEFDDSQNPAAQDSPGWTEASQSNWDNLTKEDCCHTFSPYYVHNYMKVIMVTDLNATAYFTRELVNTTQSSQSSGNYSWFHCPNLQNSSAPKANDWNINFSIQTGNNNGMSLSNNPIQVNASIQYCVAEATSPSCTVELSLQLLSLAIACNGIKLVILISLFCSTFAPLITIGDAIASFIDEPDPTTSGWGAVSAKELWKYPSLEPMSASLDNPRLIPRLNASEIRRKFKKQPWSNKKPRWSSGTVPWRWRWTISFCLLYLIFGVAMAVKSSLIGDHEDLQSVWQDGLGSVTPQRLEAWHIGFIATVVMVNLPQLILSFIYLSYNSLLTSMLLSQEWTKYAHYRKSLRVSNPRGQQRSTYFLSLPYRFSIPLLIASALLHWSLSQSIFYAQINFTDSDGSPDLSHSVLSAGYSIIGLLIALPIGAIMMIALFLLGLQHYKSGIPLVISDSRAISAACHPLARISREKCSSLEKLQYGVIADLGRGRYHVGFSSGHVGPLEEGKFYDYRGLLDDDSIIRAE